MTLKLCYLSSEYPPQTGYGGIGTYTRVMALAMAGRGHAVTVIARSETGTPYEHADGPVRVFRVGPGTFPLPGGKLLYRYRALRRYLHAETLVRLAYAREAARCFDRQSAKTPFDLVECPECGYEGHYLSLPEKTRLVVRLHTPFSYAARLDHLGLGYFDLRKMESLEKAMAQKADGLSSPSQAMADLLARRFRLADIAVFPNPMDVEAYSPPPVLGDYIIYSGRVEYRKGVHTLIKALGILERQGKGRNLVLAGAPYGTLKGQVSYESLIEGLIRKHGLEARVRWVKSPGRAEIRELLQGAALAVYPSLWENFPYACLEAMATGLPVIASDTGGYPEIIRRGESGLLFPPLNAEALAASMSAVLGDAASARRLGAAARIRVSSLCGVTAVAEAAERFYERVL